MISINQVSKSYSDRSHPAVDNISLEIQRGEIFVLLGSSGSGKSTLLKMINYLIRPDRGTVQINNQVVHQKNLHQLRRSIGYVCQEVGLFPHLSIEDNISLGMKTLGKSKRLCQTRAHELLKLMKLDPKLHAKLYPQALSGGQQQRAGVARALALDPDYLLMDEPFSALDAINRRRLQNEILTLNRKLNKTIVFVTHDIQEACLLADRIGILSRGKLVQLGAPNKIRQAPANRLVEQLFSEGLP